MWSPHEARGYKVLWVPKRPEPQHRITEWKDNMEPEKQVRVSKKVPCTKQQATVFPDVGESHGKENA